MQQDFFKVVKFQPVEILIPSGFAGTQITIPNQSSLYNKYVQAIELYPVQVMPFSPLTFTATVPNADAIKLFFEFFQGALQFANRIPACKLNRLVDYGTGNPFNNDLFYTDNWQVSWDKCNMYVADAANLTATNRMVTLGVYYTDMPFNRPVQ